MWDETKQSRLSQLRALDARGALAERQRAELTALIAERCRDEEAALEESVRRSEAENAQLAERVQQTQSQNHELEALLREQEAYLADVQEMIGQMEERRRDWRERYRRVTGKALGDPSSAESGG